MRRSILLGLAALLAALAVIQPAHAQIASLCFPETGQCIGGQIRQFWEQNGGLPVFGYPTGPQQEELVEGRPLEVQWFERFRIELHPENPPPYHVLLGRMGAERLGQQGRDPLAAFPRSAPQAGCRYFAETGHNVCGAILSYWQQHGLSYYGTPGVAGSESLGLWGLPLSDLTTETLGDGRAYQVQWFERARLELHPEQPAPYQVLGGLLGAELRAAGSAPAAPPSVTPVAPPACSDLPRSERQFSRQGITLTAANWRYRAQIGDANAGQGFRYLTFDLAVANDLYRRGGAPARIFVELNDLLLVDRQGRSLTPDVTTAKLGDRFVPGQVQQGDARVGRLAYQLPNDFIPAKLIYRAPNYPRIEVALDWPCP